MRTDHGNQTIYDTKRNNSCYSKNRIVDETDTNMYLTGFTQQFNSYNKTTCKQVEHMSKFPKIFNLQASVKLKKPLTRHRLKVSTKCNSPVKTTECETNAKRSDNTNQTYKHQHSVIKMKKKRMKIFTLLCQIQPKENQLTEQLFT